MYDSGVSKIARIILVLLGVGLGVLFIFASGCACHTADAAELEITTQAGLTHAFF